MRTQSGRDRGAVLRRVAVAALVWSHLVWVPGAVALVYRPEFLAWTPWVGAVPALLLAGGRSVGPMAAILAALLAVAAFAVAREGNEVAYLVPVLAVLASLSVALFAARAPGAPDAPQWMLVVTRFAIGLLLLITAWLGWLGPDLFPERATALARAVTGLVLLLPAGLLVRGRKRTHP